MTFSHTMMVPSPSTPTLGQGYWPALKKLQGVVASWARRSANVGRTCAYPVYSRNSTFPRSPLPNGVTRSRSSRCPRNMQPTSSSFTTSIALQQKRTSHPVPRRATTTRCRGTARVPNSGRGSGKTARAIELFHQKNPLVFTPTNRQAKEMRTRSVQTQTYHNSFRWSDQTEWTPERLRQKFIPLVII